MSWLLRKKKGGVPAKKVAWSQGDRSVPTAKASTSTNDTGWYPLARDVLAKTLKFTLDCQQPAEDTIIEPKDVCCCSRGVKSC